MITEVGLVAIRAIRSLSRASPTHWRTGATTDAGAALERIAHVRNCIIRRALESQTNGNNRRIDLFVALASLYLFANMRVRDDLLKEI
jgi:hypothetical protein